MATIPSTLEEFYKDLTKFMRITSDKRTPPESVRGAHRAIVLRYLGLKDVTRPELNNAAVHLSIAIKGATARGWDLE